MSIIIYKYHLFQEKEAWEQFEQKLLQSIADAQVVRLQQEHDLEEIRQLCLQEKCLRNEVEEAEEDSFWLFEFLFLLFVTL